MVGVSERDASETGIRIQDQVGIGIEWVDGQSGPGANGLVVDHLMYCPLGEGSLLKFSDVDVFLLCDRAYAWGNSLLIFIAIFLGVPGPLLL